MDTIYLGYRILLDDNIVHSLVEQGDTEGEENRMMMIRLRVNTSRLVFIYHIALYISNVIVLCIVRIYKIIILFRF
jgi:hypothetical protein